MSIKKSVKANFLIEFFKLIWFFILICNSSFAQLVVQKNTNLNALVKNTLIGNGVFVNSLTVNGTENSIGYFDATKTNLGIAKGILISTGDVYNAIGPNNTTNAGNSNNLGNSPFLLSLATDSMFDASTISIRFIPSADTTTFNFVFASEEYPEFVGSKFNDVFGFFVKGAGYNNYQNVAFLPGTTTPISINTINSSTNSQYYRDNSLSNDIQYDGFTVPIKIKIKTVPCTAYTLIIVISDVKDFLYDSGIFLEEGSLQSALDAGAYLNLENYKKDKKSIIEGCDSAKMTLTRYGDLSSPATFEIKYSGSATQNVDYIAPNTVDFAANQSTRVITVYTIDDGIKDSIEYFTAKTNLTTACNQTIILDSIFITENYAIKLNKIKTVLCDGDSSIKSIDFKGGSGSNNFLWVLSTGDTIGKGQNSNWISIDTPTHVYITIQDLCNGKLYTDTFLLNPTVPGTLTGNIQDSIRLCYLDTLQLQVYTDIKNPRFRWSPKEYFTNDTIANPKFIAFSKFDKTISCNIINEDVCVNKYILLVKVSNKFILDKTINNSICKGDSTKFKAIGGSTYIWSPNKGISNTHISDPYFFPDSTTKYSVQIIDDKGCEDFDTVEIKVTYPPVTAIDTPVVFICRGARTSVELNVNCTNCTKYEWSPITSLSNPKDSTPLASPNKSTTYVVKMNSGNCIAYDSIRVEVIDQGRAEISYTLDSCSKTVFLTNNSTGITFEKLDFGDGSFFDEFQQTHKYQSNGPFTINYLLNEQTTCNSSTALTVSFSDVKIEDRFIPNYMTPNEDGINDTFKITGGNARCVIKSLLIYNRWGNVIFVSENNTIHEWDGKSNGILVSPGVYFYTIVADGFQDTGQINVIY